MDYNEWIQRERRFRIKILKDSPFVRKYSKIRTCNECKEICLCHEEKCPHCGCKDISEQKISLKNKKLEKRIRCVSRFNHMQREQNWTV